MVATVPAVGFDSELDLTVHVGVPEADSFEHNKIALVARNDHEIRRVESLATSWLGAVRAVGTRRPGAAGVDAVGNAGCTAALDDGCRGGPGRGPGCG